MSQTLAESLAAAILGEEAALYAYGVAGPRLDGADTDLAAGGLAAHRQRVIALRGRWAASAFGPQPPAPGGFALPAPTDPTAARTTLGRVEMNLAATYADLAAASTGGDRLEAVAWARESAVRGVAWGVAPEAFPGRS